MPEPQTESQTKFGFNELGDRMKEYEGVTRNKLIKNIPVVIRIDGSSFHSVTSKCKKPFDSSVSDMLDAMAVRLAHDMTNTKLVYLQSDEISFLMLNQLEQGTWYDYVIQKLASRAASLATFYANQAISGNLGPFEGKTVSFDARAFNLPFVGASQKSISKEMRSSELDGVPPSRCELQSPKDSSLDEVVNYFIWRQLDCERNSVQAYSRSFVSHKELDHKDIGQMHDIIHAHGANWNDLPSRWKRGRCVVRRIADKPVDNPHFKGVVKRREWVVDNDIPIFTTEDGRNFIADSMYGRNQ